MARKRPTPFLDAARRGGRQRVTLDGVEDLEEAIKWLSDDVQGEALRGAVDAAAEIMRDVAGQLAPVSESGSHGRPSGHLSRNIMKQRKWTKTQDTAATDVGMEKKTAWYGRFAELGTSYHPATPFLRPAFDQTKDDVVDEIKDRLYRSILRHVET